MKKKRKWLAALLAAVMVLTMTPMISFAADGDTFTENEITYKIISEDEKTVKVTVNTDLDVQNPTYSGVIDIPEKVTHDSKQYTVTEIDNAAFYWTSITKITIPSSVTKINALAFYNCHDLTEVDIAESGLKEIGSNAFEYCDNLTSFSIPSTVTTIGSAAFGGCNNLTSLRIPAGVTDGLVKALVGNSPYPHLDAVTIADGSPYEIEGGVLYREDEAHLYVGPEEDVVLREGTTKIADDQFNTYSGFYGAFSHNRTLKSITIPESVTSIPANAFHSAVSLEEINLPSTLTEIGNNAFYNTGLLEIEIPDSIQTIGNNAFQDCINMISAKLPETLTSIPERMLMYGKEASNRKQEIDRQHYTIPNQRPKDKHCGKI